MEIDAYWLAIISAAAGIAGTLIGVVVTFRLSLKTAEKQFEHLKYIAGLDARNVAAKEFVTSFAADLVFLSASRPATFNYKSYFERAMTERHALAIATFQGYLSSAQRTAFKADWVRHCYGSCVVPDAAGELNAEQADDLEVLKFAHYGWELNHANPDRPRVLGLKALQKIVSYAHVP